MTQKQNSDPQSRKTANHNILADRPRLLADYEVALQKYKDPLLANIAVANSDIMRMQYQFRKMLEQALNQDMTSPEVMELLQAIFDQLMKTAKQIERFAQLEITLRREEKDAAKTIDLREAAKKVLADAAPGGPASEETPL